MKAYYLLLIGVVLSLPTWGQSHRNKCIVELQSHRGRVLDTFRARRCPEAKQQCRSELRQRHRQDRNWKASCIVTRRSGQDRRPPNKKPGNRFIPVDEVHSYDEKTSNAIWACFNTRRNDYRCSDERYSCTQCTQRAHTDHSMYKVYASKRLARNRYFLDTIHFRNRHTSKARQECQWERSRTHECSYTEDYECTPCTKESNTDHSEFSIYSLR